MGPQKVALSAVCGLAMIGIVAGARDSCVGCLQPISAGGTTTTTESTALADVDDIDLDRVMVVEHETRSFAELTERLGSVSGTTDADDEPTDTTTATDDDASTSTETLETEAAETSDGPDDSDDSNTATSTTTTSVAPSANVAAPSPVGSSVPANGAKIWVDPKAGSDSNDGSSESSALRSLQTALRRVKAGQTVYLMSGEYRELKVPNQLHYFISNSGAADNWIRITNAPGHQPVIVATNGTALIVGGAYIEVSGLRIRGEGFNKSNDWGVGISIADTHHVRVLNTTISGMATSGIGVNRASNIHLINNVVYENAFWSEVNSSGISFIHQTNRGHPPDYGPYHDVVIGNRTFRNENKVPSVHQNYKWITDGNGIIIDSNRESGYSGRTLIANNLSFDNGGRGIITFQSNHVDILFNTMFHNTRTENLIGTPAELIASRGGDIRLEYNIAWARPGNAAHLLADVSNTTTKGNILVTDAPGGSPVSSSDLVTAGNPGLRNPSINNGSADFRPLVGGALIGMAAHNGNVPSDMVGTTRNGSIEPGALEAEAGAGR